MAKKGGAFERTISEQLSLWWSDSKYDDLFWRTAGSGARATVRGRKGKRTRGHCGDICSTDKYSAPFSKLITLELKKGYNKQTIAELLDSKKHDYVEWIQKAILSAKNANTPFWMIIHKRDHRETVILFPESLYMQLAKAGGFFWNPKHKKPIRPLFKGCVRVPGHKTVDFVAMQLRTFFRRIKREHILKLIKMEL